MRRSSLKPESPGCMVLLIFLMTPAFLWLSVRSIYFNIISVPTTAIVLELHNGYSLQYNTLEGQSIQVHSIRCLGKGSCHLKVGDAVRIRYNPRNTNWVRIEQSVAWWSWLEFFLLAITPIFGYYTVLWRRGDL